MYGSETWILNKQMEDRINAFEMWIYRRIGRTSWKERKTNTEVMEKLKVKKELLMDIKIRQIKYFGHIKRHDTLLQFLLEGRVKGRRAIGRQRYNWVGNIKRWTGYSMVSMYHQGKGHRMLEIHCSQPSQRRRHKMMMRMNSTLVC